MANDFTLNSDSYDGRYLQLYCTQEKDIANNQSIISWTLSSIGGKSNYYSTGPTSVIIAGNEAYYCEKKHWTSYEFPAAKGSTNGSVIVDHDSNGDKSIEIKLVTMIYTGVQQTKTETWQLDSIQRKALITSVSNFYDVDSPSFTFSNPGNFNMKAWLEPNPVGDHLCERALSGTSGTYTWVLEDYEQEALRSRCKGLSCPIRVGLYTTVGDTVYADYKDITFTMTENEVTKPVVSLEVILNNDSLPSKFAGMYIQGKSRLDVSISAQGKYSASILSYSVDVGGVAYNPQSNSFLSNVLTKDGKVDVIGYAKDSRQFTGSAKKQIEVASYSKPLVIPLGVETAIQCYRSDDDGNRVGNSESVWIKAKRLYYSLSGNNLCALKWRRKLAKDSWDSGNEDHKWRELIPKETTTTDEYNALLSGVVFELTKSYTVQIMAIDDVGESDTKTFEIPTQDVALHLGKGGKNVSIGTYCDYSKDYTFYSWWDSYFDKDVYIKGEKLEDFIKNIVNNI